MKKFLLIGIFVAQFFIPALFALEEQEIVVIIPSYNNKEWCERMLTSILMQNYTKYTVLCYADCSTDGSYEMMKAFLAAYDKDHKVTLIYNKIRRGALANHWDAVHRCNDSALIVHLDGDDWYPHPDVLKRVNEIYSSGDVWITYGQYVEYPAMKLGHCRPVSHEIIEQRLWRYLPLPLVTTHLRTFRAALFKAIPLEDFIDQGKFFQTAWDVSFLWPILEMSGERVRFIQEILYVYNVATELNDFKIHFDEQMYNFNLIRRKKRYDRLDVLPIKNKTEQTAADVLVFSYNRPMQLYAFLESLFAYAKNIGTVIVLMRSDDQYVQGYARVQEAFPSVAFAIQSSLSPQEDFKNITLRIVQDGSNDHIVFAVDDSIVKDRCDFKECIDALDKTKAYGFYLRLGKNITDGDIPQLIPVASDIYAWQFKYGMGDWHYPNSLDMTLYKKETILNALQKLDYTNPSDLAGNWLIPEFVDYEKVGLCYETSKIEMYHT